MATMDDIRRLVAQLRESYDNGDDVSLGEAIEALEVALVHLENEPDT